MKICIQKDKFVRQLNPVLLSLTVVLTLGVGGCANSAGRAWWPQGPGNAEEVLAGQGERKAEQGVAEEEMSAEQPTAVTAQVPADSAANQSSSTRINPAIEPAPAPSSSAPRFARYADLLFVSGQVGDVDIGDADRSVSIAEETRSAMEKIRAILAAENLTMTNIVSATIFVTDLNELPAIQSAYDGYFPRTRPASSVAEVRRLPAGAHLQISVIAGR